MSSEISIPFLLNFIILIVGLEALWLIRRRPTIAPAKVQGHLLNLASGALLIMALKLVLADHSPIYLAATLGVSGLAHAASLTMHLRADRFRL